MTERIICSAVKARLPGTDKDTVYRGHRHSHALAAMNDELSYENSRRQIIDFGREQGFVTSTGRFVGRREAYEIARDAGQLLQTPSVGADELYSEDIY